MSRRYPPIHPKCPHMLHGGDYNPDQWTPDVWDEDMRLMKLSGCNAMSVGIFSWVHLEPEEGRYEFGWLDEIMGKLAANDAYAVLATPSAAQPAWMSAKYPEVLRVKKDGHRHVHQGRVKYCLTSPIYREKVAEMNARLAERYKDHPALLVWHISNEYSGECHCELCQEAFRGWLKDRYGTLEALNHAWWAGFWGHTYTDWSQIHPNDISMNGLSLDWLRFTTYQTVDFMKNEIAPLRAATPDVPITTNLMGTFWPLDYWKFVPEIDVVSWDAYPFYHDREDTWRQGMTFSFTHDIYRRMKDGKPWMLMESSPSATNWMPVGKLHRPGVHLLKSLQAVAHGSDTVQYFQWRKGRGGHEKFHGAVVDHVGHENTRVFRDVADVGEALAKLDDVVGTTTRPEVAILFDWESRWALDNACGPRKEKKDYLETCVKHYQAFWSRSIPVDVLDCDQDFSRYKLLIAPMLYMLRPGVAERIEQFVRDGGTFVATYLTGVVNESDLCFGDGFPGPLRELLGVWAEEIDCLYDDESNAIVMAEGNPLGLAGPYEVGVFCERIHAESAEVLGTYRDDFYAGEPALTAKQTGQGRAFYMAARASEEMILAFYGALADELQLRRVVSAPLPQGVTAQVRTDGESEFVFLLNFTGQEQRIDLGDEPYEDMLAGGKTKADITMRAYGVSVLRRKARV